MNLLKVINRKPELITPQQSMNMRFVVLFLAFFSMFSVCYSFARGTVVEEIVVDELTVKPSAGVIGFFSKNLEVHPEGHRIISNRLRLTILNGCEGTESMFLLAAAVLAFPSSVRHKMIGLLAGVGFVYILNQIRIASLFYALLYDRDVFHFIHSLAGPTLIVFLIGGFFLFWISRTLAIQKQHV
ncbi:MAG: archaeosortase/exosortase family protein [Gammaproteobacteria bacterium]